MTTEITPIAYNIPRAAKRAGLGETKFREAIKAGEIAYSEVGDLKLVEEDEIRRWLRSKRPAHFQQVK